MNSILITMQLFFVILKNYETKKFTNIIINDKVSSSLFFP